eukprot:CAMPEP_0119346202 /NCGR_PEP_ID=MMETSP1333-20130426/107884_1 /TAXON_ID=418940 /ORGANISM="Scyphosphaera apsteinii, Strain RCC1455" /LENGTH=35 /DNA_ID= /DNA_START= /DNA_END= /DNA_ORIENTATION=
MGVRSAALRYYGGTLQQRRDGHTLMACMRAAGHPA